MLSPSIVSLSLSLGSPFEFPSIPQKNSISCDLNILYRGSGGWIARVGRLFLSRALFWRVCNHIWIQSIHW